MDISELRKIISLVERASIEEIEIEEDGRRIRIRKSGAEGAEGMPGIPAIIQAPSPAMPPTPTWPAPQAAHPAPRAPEEEAAAAVDDSSNITIDAPMIGTFYRAPAPEAPPFVSVGDSVGPDTVVCILEAMKTMNEVKAGVRGKVVDILVENGVPVEYGQALFKIAT